MGKKANIIAAIARVIKVSALVFDRQIIGFYEVRFLVIDDPSLIWQAIPAFFHMAKLHDNFVVIPGTGIPGCRRNVQREEHVMNWGVWRHLNLQLATKNNKTCLKTNVIDNDSALTILLKVVDLSYKWDCIGLWHKRCLVKSRPRNWLQWIPNPAWILPSNWKPSADPWLGQSWSQPWKSIVSSI